jgi:hypothetical protein
LTETLSVRGSERVSPGTAAQMVRRDDAQKAGRMRYLFDVDLHEPLLYDVMIWGVREVKIHQVDVPPMPPFLV